MTGAGRALARIDLGEFGLFLALGGLAALVNWTSRFGWSRLLPFESAVAAAYVTGMVVAFVLFRIFGFPGGDKTLARQVLYFVLVNVAGIAQVWLAANALVGFVFPLAGWTGPSAEAVGHGIAIALPAVTSYFGHKHLTFAAARPD